MPSTDLSDGKSQASACSNPRPPACPGSSANRAMSSRTGRRLQSANFASRIHVDSPSVLHSLRVV